jgi:hypothetical protein
MGFWYYFWTENFIVAGSAFLLITLIVSVRGRVGNWRGGRAEMSVAPFPAPAASHVACGFELVAELVQAASNRS